MAVIHFANEVMADGPIGFWRLGEPPDSTLVADASGNQNEGACISSGITFGKPGFHGGDVVIESEVELTWSPCTPRPAANGRSKVFTPSGCRGAAGRPTPARRPWTLSRRSPLAIWRPAVKEPRPNRTQFVLDLHILLSIASAFGERQRCEVDNNEF